MSLQYDPDKKPEVKHWQVEYALKKNLNIVNIICDEDGAKPGDASGVAFIALVHTVPRIGERIILQDGRSCQVRQVFWKVGKVEGVVPDDHYLSLVTNVVAVASRKDS